MKKILFSTILSFWFLSYLSGDTGLAPEVTDLNAVDISFQKEKEIQYLHKPFISTKPRDKKDLLPVGELGKDGGKKESILKFVRKLAEPSDSPKHGKTDSLLIAHQGKLIFESYFRRGRANYPHYQMSITKSYTAYAIGRAIQLGYLSMDDLHKPVVSFLKEIKPDKLAKGADKITLDQAMQMRSGIRLPKKKIGEIIQRPSLLRGQGQARAYLQFSQDLPVLSDSSLQPFKYQSSDTVLTMQVLEAVVPRTAEAFIREQLLKPMHISNYGWQEDLSGFPKAAAGSSLLSRDMIKMGLLTLNQGKWRGQQHIPSAFVKKATTPLLFNGTTDTDYGYFWWHQVRKVKDKKYPCIQGRGAGGQFIFVFPTLDLVASVTSHNQGMGKMLRDLPEILIPAFSEN